MSLPRAAPLSVSNRSFLSERPVLCSGVTGRDRTASVGFGGKGRNGARALKTVSDFSKDVGPAESDGRLDAPAFHRNAEPLREVLTAVLAGRSGDVVEIGSGTGQHAVFLGAAFPDLVFWPTDPNVGHVASVDAWRRQVDSPNVMPASQLDVRHPWLIGGKPIAQESLTAILCFNVIHIAPWDVALAVLSSAGKLLRSDGFLILYGPYSRDGEHTAPSNATFDQTLKARNPAWGVRDLTDVTAAAQEAGLVRKTIFEMPANNLTVVFQPGRSSD